MLGMMRRARERREERERNCPCKQTCDCHRPDPDAFPSWMPYWMQLAIVLSPIWLIVLIALLGPKPEAPKRTIVVGNKVCNVIFVVTDRKCNGHGGQCEDVGYDQAVCPR